MRKHVPSAECRCDDSTTCRYCLLNAPPYFNTPSTVSEQASREAASVHASTNGGR